MYKVIQNKVPIKNDYRGTKVLGYLKKDEIIEPVRMIDNWILFIWNDKYVWVKMYDRDTYYILDINVSSINNINSINFDSSVLDPYINSEF